VGVGGAGLRKMKGWRGWVGGDFARELEHADFRG